MKAEARRKVPPVDVPVERDSWIKRWLPRLILFACVGVYLIHFYFIWTFAVNVPFWDEWDNLPGDLSLRWLFAFHNEHRIVTTKMLVAALYLLNGWDVSVHQMLNFLIYGLLLVVSAWIARRVQPGLDTWIVPAFLLFLLSPINYENHFWAFQTQFHFSLLFLLLAVYFLFSEPQTERRLLIGAMMATLTIYSLSSGLVACVVVLGIFVLFKLSRARRFDQRSDRLRELAQLALVFLLFLAVIALWLIGYSKPSNHPPLTLPYTVLFWRHYLNLVAFGFGVQAFSLAAGVFSLLLILVPVVGEVVRRKGQLPASSWAVYTVIVAILAALAAISVGRADFGVVQAKSSRYAELGMVLIPFTVLAWSLFLEGRTAPKTGVLAALWCLCFLSFADNWNWAVYRERFEMRMVGLRCAQRYYEQGGEANCPMLFPHPLSSRLDRAKERNLSFYRSLQAAPR